jgi:TPR repeat protein
MNESSCGGVQLKMVTITAQCKLGQIYALGMGVSLDMIESVNWLKRSVEQGFHEAE